LYGCGTWSLTSREEHKLEVVENEVFRKQSGPQREETKPPILNEEFHDLYKSITDGVLNPNGNAMCWICSSNGTVQKKNAYRVHNIRTNLKVLGYSISSLTLQRRMEGSQMKWKLFWKDTIMA
jgi:hypothetical protein